jgi:predicted transcriptional regulator
MADEQQSGQAQTPDRSTLGNAVTDYTTTPTRKLPAHLPDAGVEIAWGEYPKELLTVEQTKLVKGSGGVWLCHAVLVYFGAHYNAKSGTTRVSNKAIATDLDIEPATVSKCKKVLLNTGLIADTGKTDKHGVPIYIFPWHRNQINVQSVVLKSTDIQHITEQVQNTTPQATAKPTTSDPFLELWEFLIADLPNEMKSKLNYIQAKPTFQDCLANGWYEHREQLKDNVMSRIEPGHTEPGKLVNVLKEIATIKPTKPIIKCDYDNCNGNMHENVETRLPTPCPNKVQPF